jgi:phage terminase small subunit
MIKGHQAVSQRNEAMHHLQSLLSEFGLTAASILKVAGLREGTEKSADPVEQFG